MNSDQSFQAMLAGFLLLGLLVFLFLILRTVQIYRLRRDAWFAFKRFLLLLLGSAGAGIAAVAAGFLVDAGWEELSHSVGPPACAGACYGYAAAAQAGAIALVAGCFYLGCFGFMAIGAERAWRKARAAEPASTAQA